MIAVQGTIDGQAVMDMFGGVADNGVDEWTDGADPVALILAAVADTPGVSGVLADAIGRSVTVVLTAYARGEVTVAW